MIINGHWIIKDWSLMLLLLLSCLCRIRWKLYDIKDSEIKEEGLILKIIEKAGDK